MKINLFVPFRALDPKNPSLTLHKNSENIEIENISSNTVVFITEAYDRKLKPTDLMIFENTIFATESLLEYIDKKEVSINRAVYIDHNNNYYEDYYAIRPLNTISLVDYDNSEYTPLLIDEDDPDDHEYNYYKFKKIVVDPNIEKIPSIFYEPGIKNIVITESVLNSIKLTNLKGFSFLRIEDYQERKIFQENDDIIKI
jgi:hypothetical protein